MDRTNWKFGRTDINILMLDIVYNGVAFPLLFGMLEKRKIQTAKSESIVADRAFVGERWLGFLNDNNLKYYIRIRVNFKVFIPHKGQEIKAFHLFNSFRINEFVYYPKIVRINGQLCYLSGYKLGLRHRKQDFLFVVSLSKHEKAQAHYKKRWQIEMCFKAMKSSGFDLD